MNGEERTGPTHIGGEAELQGNAVTEDRGTPDPPSDTLERRAQFVRVCDRIFEEYDELFRRLADA